MMDSLARGNLKKEAILDSHLSNTLVEEIENQEGHLVPDSLRK